MCVSRPPATDVRPKAKKRKASTSQKNFFVCRWHIGKEERERERERYANIEKEREREKERKRERVIEREREKEK
jgi:hypothetical protein